jgi:type I restriction enzyme S subunit
MNKEKKQLVPEVRFPEFQYDAEWKNKQLDSLCKFVRGPFGGALKKEIFVKEGYAVYEQSQAIYNQFDVFRYFITKEKYEELKRFSVNADNIIMSCSGTMGKFSIIPKIFERGVINQALLKLTVKENLEVDFIKISLELPINQNKLLSQSAGGVIKNVVGVSELKKIKISIPSQKEQQKIANCLSSLDNLITAETEKLENLKDHKKGLLQQLFPADGETKPQYRFPEFVNDGDWEVDLFSRYIKLDRGSSPRPINQFLTNDKDGVNWIKIGDTKNATNNRISKVTQKITLAGSKKSRKVTKGELILANSMSYGATYELEIEGCIYDGWFVLRKYEDNFDKQYLLQLLNSDILQNQYKRLAAGGIVQNISSAIVYNTILPKPSIEEQQKIANCLSSADAFIEAQTTKIKALKKHKKGLMQQLFPSTL